MKPSRQQIAAGIFHNLFKKQETEFQLSVNQIAIKHAKLTNGSPWFSYMGCQYAHEEYGGLAFYNYYAPLHADLHEEFSEFYWKQNQFLTETKPAICNVIRQALNESNLMTDIRQLLPASLGDYYPFMIKSLIFADGPSMSESTLAHFHSKYKEEIQKLNEYVLLQLIT
jgi:hypothetical protein